MASLDPIVAQLIGLREASRLRQWQVAEELGFGKSSVSQWENGRREPDLATIRQLAAMFGHELLLARKECDYIATPDGGIAEIPNGVIRCEL